MDTVFLLNCDYCEKHKKGKHWTHNTDDCGHKKKAEGTSTGRPKENHMQETSMQEMLSIMQEQTKANTDLEKALLKMKQDEDVEADY